MMMTQTGWSDYILCVTVANRQLCSPQAYLDASTAIEYAMTINVNTVKDSGF